MFNMTTHYYHCVCNCACAHICSFGGHGQPHMFFLRHHPPYLLRQGVLWTRNLPRKPGWLASELRESVPSLPGLE